MDQQSRCRSLLTYDQLTTIFSRMQTAVYNKTRIRTVEHDGQHWIVFADICRALGYKNPNHESKKIRPEEKCRLDIGLKNTLAVCVNERGLYSFAVFSNKIAAFQFYQWAVKEVFYK